MTVPDDWFARTEAVLSQVEDPEVGMNIVDLGLVYDISFSSDQTLAVAMTTTTRGCPMAGFLVDAVRAALEAAGIAPQVSIALTYDPLWTPERMRQIE